MTRRILVLHGPNLNLLGEREPDVYGATTLAEIDDALATLGDTLGAAVDCRQSNHEGQLLDWIHDARGHFEGLLFNPGAYTHTSLVLADALAAVAPALPCVEVHLSNIHAREPIRATSLTAPRCVGIVGGFGAASYTLGLRALVDYLNAP